MSFKNHWYSHDENNALGNKYRDMRQNVEQKKGWKMQISWKAIILININ